MKTHRFLLTFRSNHTEDYLHTTVSNRILPLLSDFAGPAVDLVFGTKWLPSQRPIPEPVRRLARQVLSYTGVRPAMITIYDDHFKAHDEGGELTPHEHFSDQQMAHLVELFRAARQEAEQYDLPVTFHLGQVLSDEELDLLGELAGILLKLRQQDLSLLHNGAFDTIGALSAQITDLLGRSKP